MNIVVGVSDMKVSKDPDSVLVTYSLGSCIGVAIWDRMAHVGGMLHFMLPESFLDPASCKQGDAHRSGSKEFYVQAGGDHHV